MDETDHKNPRNRRMMVSLSEWVSERKRVNSNPLDPDSTQLDYPSPTFLCLLGKRRQVSCMHLSFFLSPLPSHICMHSLSPSLICKTHTHTHTLCLLSLPIIIQTNKLTRRYSPLWLTPLLLLLHSVLLTDINEGKYAEKIVSFLVFLLKDLGLFFYNFLLLRGCWDLELFMMLCVERLTSFDSCFNWIVGFDQKGVLGILMIGFCCWWWLVCY